MDQEWTMKAVPNLDSFLKESLLGEAEEDCTVDEVERGSVEALAPPLSDGLAPETPPLSGPRNPWRHSGQRTPSPHKDTTILQMTDDLLNLRARSLATGVLRVAENGHVDPDQHGPRGKISPRASGA